MAPRGRPPKPLEQHMREGTLVKSRHGGAGDLVLTGERGLTQSDPPAHLTEKQAQVWTDLVAMVGSIVRDADAAVLEGCAVAFESYRAAQVILNQEGLVVLDRFDQQKAHPMISVRNASLKLFLEHASRLGLSPADRARLGLAVSGLAKSAQELLGDRYGDPFKERPDDDEGVIDGEAEEEADDAD